MLFLFSSIKSFGSLNRYDRNIHNFSSNTKSAEPLKGLENSVVENSCLSAALLRKQDTSVRPRSVDEDHLSLKQTEL